MAGRMFAVTVAIIVSWMAFDYVPMYYARLLTAGIVGFLMYGLALWCATGAGPGEGV